MAHTLAIETKHTTANVFYDALLILTGSILIALCSHLSVTTPLTHVPFTLQNHAVLFISACLGPRRAVACIAAYLLEGAMGYPVFAHGRFGVACLLGPTGGYLMSYLPVSFIVGYLFERFPNANALTRLGFFSIGSAITLVFGAMYLSTFIGWQAAIMLGMVPFLLTDAIKTVALTAIFKK